MGKKAARASEYENVRNARMLENQARLESLGLLKTVSELRKHHNSPKPKPKKPNQKKLFALTPLRRSQRLNRTNTLPPSPKQVVTEKEETEIDREEKEEEGEEFRPANAPFVKISIEQLQILEEASPRRCNRNGRGSIYNPTLGICCHFCRQKTLCSEEDCQRCGNFDVDEPCLGKTDCSVCHSSHGVFCRACLKVRYGEEMEEVRKNKDWMCPHCVEEKGINPFWVCNSSICLRKRKIAPTGLAIYRAREMGYKSVAHLLMEELKSGKHKI
ncbi:hypothetical protein HN51_008930 [Arachis hypogaea]|uniref:Uncharacterized protein LOC107490544 isoform X1 n=1 Tax=Arachis duranensis TaxID=130453 RepID=A0A6P4DMC2_ARADU|nr:uncharacterized protein LOC107490544 isoform X1 [Arachis duranensis]XP_025701337.1 cell division cycle-associated protein 7 isoform X1 [Arachis hypogaea]